MATERRGTATAAASRIRAGPCTPRHSDRRARKRGCGPSRGGRCRYCARGSRSLAGRQLEDALRRDEPGLAQTPWLDRLDGVARRVDRTKVRPGDHHSGHTPSKVRHVVARALYVPEVDPEPLRPRGQPRAQDVALLARAELGAAATGDVEVEDAHDVHRPPRGDERPVRESLGSDETYLLRGGERDED